MSNYNKVQSRSMFKPKPRGRGGRGGSNRNPFPPRSQRLPPPRGQRQPSNDFKRKSAPVAKTKVVQTSRPKIQQLQNGDIIVTFKEYVQDVVAGTGTPSIFKNTQIPINPAQQGSFQWLAQIAANYESYLFEKLEVCYETEASSALGGTVVLSIDYDAADSAPTTKQQALSTRRAVRSAPWTECKHVSLREDLSKSKTYYTRRGGQPAATDIKTYDVGNLNVCSQGVATAGATLGEIYFSYTVRLMTPQPTTASDLALGGMVTGATAQTAANPFGTGPALSAGTAGLTVDAASNVTFQFPGTYLAELSLVGTVLTAASATIATGGNSPTRTTLFLASGLNGTVSWQIKINDPNTVCAFAVTGTTVTTAVLRVAIAPAGSI